MGSQRMLSIVDSEREEGRRADRTRVLLVARLETPTRELSVRIRDVSSGGARLEGADLPPEGSVVVLRRGVFEAFGRVAWRGDGTVGIAFDEPVEDGELLAALRGMPEPKAPEPYKRGGFGRQVDAPRLSDGRGWLTSLPGRA